MLFFKARFETFQIYWDPRLRTSRGRPEILHGPCDGLVQFASRTQWPIRIAQKLTGDNHGVRLFRPNNVLRLNWRSNHPHRAGHDSSFATNPFGEVRLVTGTDRNFRVRHIATRRTVDEIDAYLLQLAGKFDGLINIPAIRRPNPSTKCAEITAIPSAIRIELPQRSHDKVGFDSRTNRRNRPSVYY